MTSGIGVDLHCYYQRGAQVARGVTVEGKSYPIEYAWIKLTDGDKPYSKTISGVTFRPDALVTACHDADIPVGGYCYAQPGDGARQADVLINYMESLGATGVVPAIDIESNPAIHTWSASEATTFGRAFGRQAIARGYRHAVYMNDSLAGQCDPASWPEDPLLWIARYGAAPKQTPFDVHQFSSSASIPGSAGAVDVNQAYPSNLGAQYVLSATAPQKEVDMDEVQTKQLNDLHIMAFGDATPVQGLENRPGAQAVWEQVSDIQNKITALVSAEVTAPVAIDYTALAKALIAELKA